MANSYVTRTPSSTGNNQKFTISLWLKRSGLSSQQIFTNAYYAQSDNGFLSARFTTDDKFELTGWSTTWRTTNRVFRDTSGWYHIVIAIDTTLATAGDRIKIYVNGSQETSFGTSNDPSLNHNFPFNTASFIQDVGCNHHGSGRTNFFDGYITHYAQVDGSQLTPTSFGETDSTSGIWKFKSPSGITWGTNGVHLKFENSGAMGTDSSGNSNTYTVGGNLKQSLDTPSNNHSTINGLFRSRFLNQATLTNGNLTMTTGPTDGDKALLLGTQGVTKGKWYWECKVGADRSQIGFAYDSISRFSDFYGSNSPSDGFSVYGLNGQVYYDGGNTAYGSTWTTNDIIMVALDMDNKLAWLGKNGTWMNSATQTEIENGTATNDLTTKMGTKQNLNSGEPVFPLFADSTGTGDIALNVNFGNGFFGTTAITSAGSNGNGSLFEYNVPSGYYALNTKNINTYG